MSVRGHHPLGVFYMDLQTVVFLKCQVLMLKGILTASPNIRILGLCFILRFCRCWSAVILIALYGLWGFEPLNLYTGDKKPPV